ncbi:MAG: alpha/beta fold hydrolase [Agriterribacter sp.]
MKSVYCICGLGSDERIFSKLNWFGANVQYLHWLMPEPDESLTAYAARMSKQIEGDDITLIGVSFGGIMSIEIAKLRKISKVILISSIPTHREMPAWMKTCGRLKLDFLVPRKQLHSLRPMKLFTPVENYFLGATTEEAKKLANEYREKVDPHYLKWSIHNILNWKNDWVPENFYHLHGSNDKIFPHSRLKPTHIIDGAGHFLVFQRASEVSEILKEII